MYAYKQYPPTEEDKALARQSKQTLAHHVQKDQSLTLQVVDGDGQPTIKLPPGVVKLLMDILGTIASGQGMTVIPQEAELTTVQAAEILNVSRPHVVKLLEEGVIPHHKVGTHRRVRLEDVIQYKQKIDQESDDALEKLTALSQELGLYD